MLVIAPLTTSIALPTPNDQLSRASKAVRVSLKRATNAKSASNVPVIYDKVTSRWFTDVIIGGQQLTLSVDTGSGDL